MNSYLRQARIGWPRALDYLPLDPQVSPGVTPRRSMAPFEDRFSLRNGKQTYAEFDKAETAKLDTPIVVGVDFGVGDHAVIAEMSERSSRLFGLVYGLGFLLTYGVAFNLEYRPATPERPFAVEANASTALMAGLLWPLYWSAKAFQPLRPA